MSTENLFDPDAVDDGRKPWQGGLGRETGLSRADHPETSVTAALTLKAGSARLRVLRAFVEHGSYGMTDEEMIRICRLSPSTGRPRRVELVVAGYVEDSGDRRDTEAGRSAIVWRITPDGSRAFEGRHGTTRDRWGS